MSRDLVFRIILVVLSAALYLNHHVIHRRPSVQKSAFRGGPDWINLWIAVTASSWTLALALYAAGWRFDYALPLPEWARWLGVAAMLSCAPLSQWTYRTLGAHFSKKLELRKDHRLIRGGPYRFVRHPMYATLFLCAASTCLISASCMVVATVFGVASVFLLRIKKEEVMLVERFGEEYREYRRKTRALVPGLL